MEDIEKLIIVAQQYGKPEKDFVFNIIIKQYKNQIANILKQYYGTKFYEDLLQECYIKIYDLISKFDYNKQTKFITIMTICLNRIIQRKIRYEYLIRVPEYISKNDINIIVTEEYIVNNKNESISIYDLIPSQNETELKLFMYDIKTILNKDEYRLLSLLYQGYTVLELVNIFNIKNKAIYERIYKIKNKIIKYLYE